MATRRGTTPSGEQQVSIFYLCRRPAIGFQQSSCLVVSCVLLWLKAAFERWQHMAATYREQLLKPISATSPSCSQPPSNQAVPNQLPPPPCTLPLTCLCCAG